MRSKLRFDISDAAWAWLNKLPPGPPFLEPGERYKCTSPGEPSCNTKHYFERPEYRGEVCIAAGPCLWLKKVEK